MDSQTIRTALGKLQADPDSQEAWSALREAVSSPTQDLEEKELLRLLDAARQRHRDRGEWDAVAALLRVETQLAAGSSHEPELVAELARVMSEELFEEEAARDAYARFLELQPDDARISAALQETEGKRQRWQELATTYLTEAEQAPDEVYKSSMLMRATEMEVRFAGTEADLDSMAQRLEQAVRLDPTNERAGRMLERLYRKAGRWEEVARVLERLSDRSENTATRVGAGVRLARTYMHKLEDKERAARAYDRVLRDDADHAEARGFLVDFYASEERWDELVVLYERELRSEDLTDSDRLGDMLQIAMLHWKKRENAADAEPWFERIRKIEPAHEGALTFYRDYCEALHDDARLMEVLQGAQRSLKDGAKHKAKLGSEIARLAEGQENAQKAIEQYKSVLRQDPDNADARAALKRLYKQTQGFNALVELLRQELERTSQEAYESRLAILREVATVYRQYIKSDTALVSVLNQIVQLDEKIDEQDADELRELCSLYEKLGRWRDLLTNQLKLAEVSTDLEEKKTLYRSAARRWLEQFSNVQNAAEAYAALLGVAPDDSEARERLEELYRKRRAWPALYELFEKELRSADGPARVALMREMAQLAAERLNRGPDAVRLYKEILQLDSSRVEVLDALEKHAERAKDWPNLAEALELRSELASDPAQKLGVLQKLGGVYADHLGDQTSAARTWQRVLAIQPGHARALRVLRDSYLQSGDYEGLTELYATHNDWEGLAEVFTTAADRAKDGRAKIELSYRAASVFVDRLEQPERAFRSYERVLAADAKDARAARALIPIYEKDEKWTRLAPLYEVLYESADSEAEKLELLTKLVEVTGQRLSDRRAAAAYARKAYDLVPGSETALELLETATRAAGTWEPFVQALEARLTTLRRAPAQPAAAGPTGKKGKRKKKAAPEEPAVAEADESNEGERRHLELKLARVYAEELGRTEDAIAHYKRWLERDPADFDAAQALESILRREDRRDDLRWLLELRVDNAPGQPERVRMLSEWAVLEEDVFDAPDRAAQLYQRVLEVDGSDEDALSALPRLLLASGDAEAAARVIEQHRDQLDDEERAEREIELAELYLSRLDRPRDALASATGALGVKRQDPRAMGVLERLLEHPELRAQAARMLAEQYATGGEARREAHVLGVMLEQSSERDQRRELYARLADVHEQKLGATGTALEVMLRALSEYPDELLFWDRAEALATAAGRPTELAETFRDALRQPLSKELEAELCERAAQLHEDRLGDPLGAAPYLERVLAQDPSNERAFLRLKDILTAAERWGELEALYDRAASATDDADRRIEMLVEVALICEEIIEDPEKATRYYERILKSDPLHDAAVRALDRLYAAQGRHRDLAHLLERRVAISEGSELLDLKLRLARIQLERLHEPDKAITHVEDVLSERQNDYQARELAERLLDIGSLRVRAACMLEGVYEARSEIRDLVRVLSIRLEDLGASEASAEEMDAQRKELLRRIATLRDERLHEDEGALDALAELVPLEPFDVDARNRLVAIGRRTNAHQRVAEVLARAADRADTPALKGEILMLVAGTFEEHLRDGERAEHTYRRVLLLDETDADLALPAARALERIYVQSGQHQKLADILRVQVRLEQDSDARRELLGRLGELCQNVLSDTQGAIVAWRARADENPGDQQALAALDGLYERSERWRDLVTVIDKRRELVTDPEIRRTLMVRSAQILSTQLGTSSEAIEAWRAVLDEYGPDEQVLSALERLYLAAERWDELGETYERHLEIATSDAQRLELLAQNGDLKRQHLDDVPGALEVYRRALALDAAHPPSRSALEGLLASEDKPARREAAEILHPIYETESDYERLLKVIEIEVATADDPLQQLDGLEKAMRVAEHSLHDPARAFNYAERAVRVALGHTEITRWLEHEERLAAATGRQADYVRLLCDIVPDIFDGEVQLAVTLKIADLARHQLADRELARTYYQKALELRADDRRALSALESLYEESGDAQSLLDVLERRVESAENEGEKKQLMFRRARLLAEVLGDPARAIPAYEAILDLDMDPAAIEALARLYPSEQRWSELIELYQTQLEHRVGNPADLHVNIARIAALHLNDVPRAFDELHQALDLQKQHEGAIAELERLLSEAPEAEHRARAASLLEPVYLQRADFGKVMTAIRARLEFTGDPEERRELLSRLAQLYEEQTEDYVAALETVAKLFHDDPANEATTVELERLAKVAGSEARLAEIYATELDEFHGDDPVSARLSRRAGELFAALGESERALGLYRRALAFEPENKGLFDATDGLLRKMSRPVERVELHREALDHRFDPKDRLDLLHTIARLQREELAQPDTAIETYRAALEVSETDARALDALTELYREKSQWHDLAELYLRRAEESSNVQRGAEYRLALARLQRRELSDVDRALDQLEEIVRFAPDHAEAIAELESLREDPTIKQRVVEILRPLYEATDDWRHLIKLNEDRFALAESNAEKVTVLSETAQLWERRGGDLDRARRALAVAFKLDPDDGQVRAEYERLAGSTRAWDQLTETYEEALAEAPDLISKRDILAVLANVHDEKRDDPRRALLAYDRLREADETELLPLEKMEQLATLLSDWPILVRALTAKTELVDDDAERASLWRRIGEAKRDMLDDRDGAVAAYEQALELEADSTFTVDCLIELYETEKNPSRLVELYERRVELSDEEDADLKYTLLTSAARTYETDLADRANAIERLNEVLVLRPTDRDALVSRGRLYRDEEMWPELLENLRLEAAQAESGAPRAAIEQQMGRILAEKLSRYEDALDAYRRSLQDSPEDAVTVAAVEEIGADHDDLKLQVADILVPVLKGTKRHDELVKVLEMRLGVESEPEQRSETLKSIAEVLERELGRSDAAQRALLRALVEQPDSEQLHQENERLAELANGWALYADALAERAASTFDPEIAKALYVRVGRVAEDKLRDERRAVDAYGRAIEQVGDQPELLAALDRLYTRLGDAQALSEVLERRVAIEESDTAQAELYFRLGTVQIGDFAEPARGLGFLRMALERAPEHEGAAGELEKLTAHRDLFEEAADVLESVYRSRSRADKLPGLYEKRVAFADGADERVDTRLRLARVLEEDCAEPVGAQRAVEQALSDDPAADRVREELERLAGITGDWQGAARAMTTAVEGHPELLPQVASELLMHVAEWLSERASDSAGAEQALRKALEIDPQNDAVLHKLEDLQRAAGRDADLSVTLRTRGRLQQEPHAREELFRQAKELLERQGGPGAGEPVLRELLDLDETNLWALAELTEIRENAGDYAETFQLVARRSELGADGAAVRQLRKKAAQLARDRLAQPGRASELYEHLFEDDPNDTESARALRELYDEQQNFDKLGRLLERLIDMAESPEERTSLRIELARLNDQRFESPAAAIELLRAALDEQPGHAQAVVALSELYERTGRDEELAELLDDQIALARARNDVDSELRLQVRLGDIYESRLADRAKAIETYQGVLERDPQQRAALEALARLFDADNKPAEAAKVLERLLDGSDSARAVELSTALADTYARLGDNESAARALERGLVADERNATLRERLAELYTASSSWERLAEVIARDAELSEGDEVKARLLRQAAKVHAEKRQSFGQAAELLERASQIKPDDRELLLELCDAYSASGRGAAAATVLERIVQSYAGRRSKELGEIHRRLADAYLAENDVPRALDELDKAFKIEPSNVQVLKKLSEVAMIAGDYKKAHLVLRSLMMQKLDAGSGITRAEVFMRIAEVHEKSGEREKAIQMLERSLQADDKLSAARERLAALRAG